MFLSPPPKKKTNFRVVRVKHFLMSSPCAMTMLIFLCWEQSEGEALMKHTLIRPVGVVSASISKGRILHISCDASVFDEGMKAAFCDRQVSYICASIKSYYNFFVCKKKKTSLAEVIKHGWHQFHIFPLRAALISRVAFCVFIYHFCLVVWP